MAMDVTQFSSKYYTYYLKSNSNCFNISWTFLKYSKLEIEKEYKIPSFRPVPEIHLELIFRKNIHREICLYVVNKLTGVLRSDISIAMFDDDGKELYRLQKVGVVINKDKTDLMPNIDQAVKNSLNSDRNDTITLDIEFRFESALTWGTHEQRDLDHWKRETKFAQDLKKFILEKHPSNVVLKSKDSQTEVNKALLCARSPVFQKMFDNPMREEENDTVLIDDLSGSTLKTVVDFVNNGEVELDTELSCLKELYYAADKYDIVDLKNMCAANIVRGLTKENVPEMLEMAHKHSDERLKIDCMIFIRRFFVCFMNTDGWKNLKTSNPHLALELVEFNMKDDSNVK